MDKNGLIYATNFDLVIVGIKTVGEFYVDFKHLITRCRFSRNK
jgi:hypothetical protein